MHRVPGEGDLWQADYRGDNWTTAFRTVPGYYWLVKDALLRSDLRKGLPIVDDSDDLALPVSPVTGSPDFDDSWPGGHAA